jgi:hypothetical protein
MIDRQHAELAETKSELQRLRERVSVGTYGSQGPVLDFVNPEMVRRRNRHHPGRILIRD